MLTNQRDAFRG